MIVKTGPIKIILDSGEDKRLFSIMCAMLCEQLNDVIKEEGYHKKVGPYIMDQSLDSCDIHKIIHMCDVLSEVIQGDIKVP